MSRFRSIDKTSQSVFHNRPPKDALDQSPGGRDGLEHSGRSRDAWDVHSVFSRGLDLPRTSTRERVFVKDRSYELRASEVCVLSTIGAFRVVDARDLEGGRDARSGDLARLRHFNLVGVAGPQFRDGERAALVTLTKEGKDLLEQHRSKNDSPDQQEFYAGLAKPREATHDAPLYRVYEHAANRLQDGGARIQRVVLDYELKREYQRFLQTHNRGNRESSGRPTRSPQEIHDWAAAHHLPVEDGRVQFPDVRIEYEHPDGRPDREDLELATEHYSARQMAGKRASGFTVVRGSSSRRGSAPFNPQTARKAVR